MQANKKPAWVLKCVENNYLWIRLKIRSKFSHVCDIHHANGISFRKTCEQELFENAILRASA